MLICQHNAEFGQATGDEEDCDWSLAARAYPELREMPSYISQQRQEFVAQSAFTTTAHASHLQGNQLQAYTAVREHSESSDPNRPPLRMVVSGTAGTGKSYLIQCLKLLLKDRLCVAAPTGVAAFNVDGYTLHSLLSLPVKGDFKPLEGKRLQTIQQMLAAVDYIIIDEMSMVGRKMFGQVDRRLRQVFPERSEELFGGRSCLLTGDWGQLPPVMDLPLYTTVSRTELSDLGSIDYHLFHRAVVLDRVMRQAGQDAGQECFQNLLLRLRNAELTVEDWKYLMTRTTGEVGDTRSFDDALRLHPTIEAVAEHNVAKLRASGQPIAVLRAVHTGPGASTATLDDAGGLEPVICIAHGARVMLSANLWVEVGLVNGALGTQGLTLNKAVIDIGKKEFSTGLTFVACSRVRQLTDLLFVPPFSFQRVANLSKSVRLKDRLQEDSRLQQMSTAAPNVSSSSSELQWPPSLCPPSQPPLPPSPHPLLSPVQTHKIEILDGSLPPSTPSQLLLLPSPHPIPSPALSTESHDIEILGSSQAYICPYKYHPVNEEWQRVTCENMGLMYCGSNRTAPGGLHIPLTVPASVRSIKGDGNCFFRSISYVTTGCEEQHEFVRRAILTHMRAFGHLLFLWLNGRTIDNVEEYIQLSGME